MRNEGALNYLAEFYRGKKQPKRVLEIGPEPDFGTAKHIHEQTGAHITFIGSWEKDYERLPEWSRFISGDVTKADYIEDDTFDLIVGYHLLEHVKPMQRFADVVKRILKPKGVAHLTGGALWSSRIGHHLWLDVNGHKFRFGDSSNCIPDWGHLVYDEPTLKEIVMQELGKRGFKRPGVAGEAIVRHVYHNPDLNRVPSWEILETFLPMFRNVQPWVKDSPDPEDPFVRERLRRVRPIYEWTIHWMSLLLEN